MPNYETHCIFNWIMLVVLGVVAYQYYPVDWKYLVFGIGYIIGTVYITPDLDTNSSVYNPLWYIYKLLFKHRGLSHNIFIGFITRLIYLGLVFYGIWYALNYFFHIPNNIIEAATLLYDQETAILLVEGLAVANSLHVVIDVVSTTLKRAF